MAAKKTRRIGLITLVIALVIAATAVYVHNHNIAVLEPRGPVGQKEKGLITFTIVLSAIVVIPVYILTILIAVKYREGSRAKKKYRPDSDHSRVFELVWWGIPIVIIGVLSVVDWQSSHALDPYKPLASTNKPVVIDVVNLDWKWLFLYPKQQVASVNQVAIPVGTPVTFHITSDTVMNSFWIPQLGSQIYAMPGMVTQLNLQANKAGDYLGSPANISGAGFAGMTFDVKALRAGQFTSWVHTASKSPNKLTLAAYNQLAQPSQNNPVAYYSSPSKDLFTYTVMKYMEPEAAP